MQNLNAPHLPERGNSCRVGTAHIFSSIRSKKQRALNIKTSIKTKNILKLSKAMNFVDLCGSITGGTLLMVMLTVPWLEMLPSLLYPMVGELIAFGTSVAIGSQICGVGLVDYLAVAVLAEGTVGWSILLRRRSAIDDLDYNDPYISDKELR
jgi:hypothetical protein